MNLNIQKVQKYKKWIEIHSKIKSKNQISFVLVVEGNNVVEFIESE